MRYFSHCLKTIFSLLLGITSITAERNIKKLLAQDLIIHQLILAAKMENKWKTYMECQHLHDSTCTLQCVV